MTDNTEPFDAEALLEQALRDAHYELPPAYRDGVLMNLRRIHGMVADLDALPPMAAPVPASRS